MGSNWFVTPETVRLTVSDGVFIDVKKRLNHGEQEDLWARMSPYIVPGEAQQFHRREVRTSKVLAYLLGWSLATQDGKPVPMSPDMPEQARLDTLRSLHPVRFTEIYTAIEAHETAMEAERTAQKKTPSGTPADDAISSLPSAAAGPLPTSVN